MTNTDRRVLKIPRSLGEAGGGGGGGDYVLLYVCRDRDGSLDLDLKLIATEGNNPYVGSGEYPRRNCRNLMMSRLAKG